MSIVDQFGNPIERANLQEPQTTRLASLRTEFENHPSRGLTPPRLASILQRAEQGDLISQHELFQDMEEKDGHLFSEMQKRRTALQNLDWDIVPPPNASAAEKDLAIYAKEMLGTISDVQDIIFDLTDAIGHGYAGLELQWQKVERNLLPMTAIHRPQAWFCIPTSPNSDRNELRLRDGSPDGEALWPFGWLLHKHKARSGYVSRSGLFRVLAWPFLFKNYAVRDLAEFLEIYGLPLRLGTYNTAATEADKATLLRAVVSIGHDAAAIVPEGMKIDFKEAAKGDDQPFDSMIDRMDAIESKVILGGTLTSGEGQHGTQALGNVHNEVRHELMKSDARQLAYTLTAALVYPILAVNKGMSDMRRCPRLVFDTQEPEDLKLYADAVPNLVKVGMRIPSAWAHDKLKIPQAKNDEAVLQVAAAPATAQPGQEPLRAALAAQPTADADELDVLAAEMLGEWENSLADLVEPVEAALASATNFEDFQAELEQRISDIDPARLVEILARGNFSARIWGRVNTSRRQGA
jgi:phage gp29-like protein